MTEQNSGKATMRVGVIGCGLMADIHLRALRQIENVRAAALCDRDGALALQFARNHRIPAAYHDVEAMLTSENLDVVHVTTPPRTHAAICGVALRGGCHVLVEKPVALTTVELDGMLAAGSAAGVTLSVVHNGLYQRAFSQALRAVKSGAIGELRSVHILDHIPSNYEVVANAGHWCHGLPGGVFGEVLPHDIYLADALVPNLKLDDVRTRCSGRFPWLPVEQVFASLSSHSTVVTIHASVDGGDWNKTIDMTGSAGSVRVDRMCDIVTSLRPTADWTLRPHVDRVLSHLGGWMQQTAGIAAARLAGQPVSGHDALIRGFYSSLFTGDAPPSSQERLRQTTMLHEALTTAIDSIVAAT